MTSIHTHKIVDGIEVSLTEEEVAELDARDAAWEADASNRLLVQIRLQRDQLLSECDYLMNPDYPIDESLRDEWKTYRQALRDLPENIPAGTVNMEDVVWPVAPENR